MRHCNAKEEGWPRDFIATTVVFSQRKNEDLLFWFREGDFLRWEAVSF
jgi:hypothetical protein